MYLSLLSQISTVAYAAGLVDSAAQKFPEPKILFKSIIEEKEEQLKTLKEEKAALEIEKETVIKSLRSDIEEQKNKKLAAQKELEKEPQDEFLIKKVTLISETFDALNDLQRTWENILKKITDNIQLLEKYLKDPDLKEFKKNLKMACPYFFEDLEDVYQKIASEQKFVEQLKKRKENIIKEQKELAKNFEKMSEEYNAKKSKQEEFNKMPKEAQTSAAPFGLSVPQRAELLTLETALSKLKKELVELQGNEKKYELGLIDNEIFIENLQLDILQDVQKRIKSSITVTPEQIEASKQELEKKKQSFSILKTRYNDEINKLRRIREDETEKLAQLSKRYGITLGNELDTWSIQPKKTLDSYVGLCKAGLLNTYVRLLEDREALFTTLIALEQEKINYAEQIVTIKDTYYKTSISKFTVEEHIAQEIKKYTDLNIAYEASIKKYKAKKDEVEASVMKLQNEVIDRLKKRKVDIQQHKDSLFKNYPKEYITCLSEIEKAEEFTLQRIDIASSMSKAYGEMIALNEKIIGYTHFILTELESITIWYRPEYAISWAGIRNITKDIRLFLADVKSYIKHVDVASIGHGIKDVFKKPLDLFVFIFKILIIFTFFIVIRRHKSILLKRLNAWSQEYKGFKFFFLLACLMVGFIADYTWPICCWFFGLIFIQQFFFLDPYVYVLFYLISIPYLLYVAYRFTHYFVSYNYSCNNCLISQEFQSRFVGVFSTLLYSTIGLILFRQAVLLVKLPKSELPTILLALNFIIFQIALIFLISKEQILSIIPTKYELWQWIYKLVDRYYYIILLVLVLIIIMSNPYVGYGRLVLYVLSGLLYTAILIKLMLWGHALVKRAASHVFFQTQEDVTKERFAYAKTWFGVAIIISFLLFTLIGIIVGAKIWGWSINFIDIYHSLDRPLFGIGKGTKNPLTIITLLTILLFILAGFLLAFAFNQFVLQKIFDLMLVETGLQHAITSLVRYILVAASIVLGFQSVGFGGILTYIYVLILGIGYLIQNPLNDFVAYFIILMQRPIKVGDFIKVDEEIIGVVRKITPKSVMLRKKNSTTIVVPNAQIINKPLVNWNYTRNFIAFDDITIGISYKADPNKVKDLLLSAVISHPNVLKNPKPVIRLDDFKDYGFEFMVRGFLSSNFTLEKHDIASDVRLSIVKTLRENNVEIAIPVRIMISPTESFTSLPDKTK